MKKLNLPTYTFKFKTKEQKKYIYDQIRKKFVQLTPEEWVRQNFLAYLIRDMGYSGSLISVEMGFRLYKVFYRADIVVFNRQGNPALIVECKAPEIAIKQAHFDQITRYNYELKVRYLVVTNGLEHYCAVIDYEQGGYQFLKEIPPGELVHQGN